MHTDTDTDIIRTSLYEYEYCRSTYEHPIPRRLYLCTGDRIHTYNHAFIQLRTVRVLGAHSNLMYALLPTRIPISSPHLTQLSQFANLSPPFSLTALLSYLVPIASGLFSGFTVLHSIFSPHLWRLSSHLGFKSM